MTKVQIHFHLLRALDETLMQRISDANSIYGIERITVQPNLEDIAVEFDASRLKPAEVESVLAGFGIPAEAK